jgi:hypothetical protein
VANFIKIGHTYLNLDRVLSIDDRYTSAKEDTMVIHFSTTEEGKMTLANREADLLRTWLNSVATDLRASIERATGV